MVCNYFVIFIFKIWLIYLEKIHILLFLFPLNLKVFRFLKQLGHPMGALASNWPRFIFIFVFCIVEDTQVCHITLSWRNVWTRQNMQQTRKRDERLSFRVDRILGTIHMHWSDSLILASILPFFIYGKIFIFIQVWKPTGTVYNPKRPLKRKRVRAWVFLNGLIREVYWLTPKSSTKKRPRGLSWEHLVVQYKSHE